MTPAVIVAIVSAAIALSSLTYTIWDKTRGQRRRLRWYLFSNTSLMSAVANDRSLDKLSVHWEGNEVKKPRLAVVSIINSGKIELKEADISVRPHVQVAHSKIVSAQIVLRTLGSDRASVIKPHSSSETMIEAPPVVLNPKDRITFSLLLDGEEEDIRPVMQAAGFRFESGEDAARESFRARFDNYAWVLAIVLILFLGIAIAIGIINEITKP